MWSCWAPQTHWTWWGRGWGRTRAVSLGLWKKQLQERWRCSESVEKGAAREDIPDTSKAPVKSQYQDFPKRKNNWRREIPLCAHLYVVVVVAKGKSNGSLKKKKTLMVSILQQPCALGETLSPRAQVCRVDTDPRATGGWPCMVQVEKPRSGPPGRQMFSLLLSLLWCSWTWTNHFMSLCLYFPAVKWR